MSWTVRIGYLGAATVLAAIAPLFLLAGSGGAAPGSTALASVDSSGTQGNGFSTGSVVSGDGRYVTFFSTSSTLVPNDTNGVMDVFVRDLRARTTERVTLSSCGSQGNGHSFGGSISSDGRYVGFDSGASNLVPGDTNRGGDVFVRDRQAGPTEPSDCTTPTTEHSLSSPNANGWNSSDYTVILSARDDESGSGVGKIRFSATGAQVISETVYDGQAPPVISAEGTTTVSYFVTDKAGNKEFP